MRGLKEFDTLREFHNLRQNFVELNPAGKERAGGGRTRSPKIRP